MIIRIERVACAVLLGAAILLSACSDAGNPQSQTHAPDAVARSQASLKISSYGPDEVVAGKPFNVQPDGQAAVWVRVDRSLAGSEASIYLNDERLDSAVSADLITASVPAKLYAKPGTYVLRVTGVQNGVSFQSDPVNVLVR
jgi:hypothetical protein